MYEFAHNFLYDQGTFIGCLITLGIFLAILIIWFGSMLFASWMDTQAMAARQAREEANAKLKEISK